METRASSAQRKKKPSFNNWAPDPYFNIQVSLLEIAFAMVPLFPQFLSSPANDRLSLE
jgi:hypothetical protein